MKTTNLKKLLAVRAGRVPGRVSSRPTLPLAPVDPATIPLPKGLAPVWIPPPPPEPYIVLLSPPPPLKELYLRITYRIPRAITPYMGVKNRLPVNI